MLRKENLRASVLPILVTVVFTLGLGVSFIGSIGPLSLPDPPMHAYEIYALATGQSFSPSSPMTDDFGNQQMAQTMTVDARVGNANCRNEYVYRLITLPRNDDPERAKQVESLAAPYAGEVSGILRRSQYFPFAYAPQAVAVSVATALGGSPWNALQGARVVNLLLALVLEVAAIYVLPKGKWAFALVSSMPVSVFLAASISVDALIPGISMLLIGLAMRSLERRRMSNVIMASCVLLAIALLFLKTAYATVALALLALPNEVVSWRKKAVSATIALIVFLGANIWWKSVTGLDYTFAGLNIDNNIKWISSHPLHTVACFAITLVTLPYQLTAYGLDYFISVALVAIVVVVVHRRSKSQSARLPSTFLSWLSRWRIPLAGIAATLLSLLAIYVTFAIGWTRFTAAGWASGLFGMQERYFIPLFPLAVLALYPVVTERMHPNSEECTGCIANGNRKTMLGEKR